MRNLKSSPRLLGIALVCLHGFCYLTGTAAPAASQPPTVRREMLPDGVERWYLERSESKLSSFFQAYQDVYKVFLPSATQPPFTKSAALLLGVRKYKYLVPDLPSVTNDLNMVREFLLQRGGFDEVFIMKDEVVNRDLVEKYIKAKLPESVGEHGRILFYYSGHGGDPKGARTGYMQFAEAKSGQNFGQSVLPINAIMDWCREVEVKHMMFLLDCCASGLAFTAKTGETSDSDRLLINTLAGDGSRAVLSAGTEAEPAYALSTRLSTGNGVFTRAFLSVFDHSHPQFEQSAVLTTSEIYSVIEKEVAAFRGSEGKSVHPRLWTLMEADYKGTFVFINPYMRLARLSPEHAKVLNLNLKAKGSDSDTLVSYIGTIQLSSYLRGRVLIDDKQVGSILEGETRAYFDQSIGEHKVEVRGAKAYVTRVLVKQGEIAKILIARDPEPVTIRAATNTVSGPTGSLRFAFDGLAGPVFVDGIKVGVLNVETGCFVEKLSCGEHTYEVRGEFEHQIGKASIEANKTTYISIRPAPPLNLRVIPSS